MHRLDDKVALVTGGSSGIGRSIALAFAQEGADVCISGRDMEKAKTVAGEIEASGSKSLVVQVDIEKLADLDRMVASAIEHFGQIDILVNNVGGGPYGPILETSEADFDSAMGINLKGLFFLTQRVVPHMIKQGKGKVINITSNFGAIGRRSVSLYSAAKAGVISLTKSMALEFAPNKINVNAIGPAFTETPLTKPALADPKILQMHLDEIPLGRPGRPEEIASAAVYLASDESDFVTGQTLFVDGGFLCG